MNLTTQSHPGQVVETEKRLEQGVPWLLIALFFALWALVFNALRIDWSSNPQYNYGWFVPLLAFGLFAFQWRLRPVAEPPPAAKGRIALLAISVALAALLPIRLVQEANPEWRLILWLHASQMVLLTLCCLYYAGGWDWVGHFAFPVCFTLVAVPWPVPLEQLFVQNLMRVVAAITVEAVGLFNIPAVQHGNIIQISSGLVGVDEACSGVRSLQTALFVCLFLGELYRFSLSRRFLLLFLGFAAALLCNVGRTFFLVWSASQHGIDSMHALHDTAGNVVLMVTLASILLLTQLLRKHKQTRQLAGANTPATFAFPSNRFLFAGLIWLALAEFATQAWYRSHEADAVETARWSVTWPESQNNAEKIPIDSTVQAMLRCNEAKAEAWCDTAGNRWQAFFFRWAPGRNSAQLASAHTPDICLRGVGYQLAEDLGLRTISVEDINLPFHQYVFTHGLVQLHVFYCRWEDHLISQRTGQREDGTKLSRIRAVLAGRRHLGQRVLEIAINGPSAPEEAFHMFEQELRRIVRR